MNNQIVWVDKYSAFIHTFLLFKYIHSYLLIRINGILTNSTLKAVKTIR